MSKNNEVLAYVEVMYVGTKPRKRDTVNQLRQNRVWDHPGAVVSDIPANEASFLLKYPKVWRDVSGMSQEEQQELSEQCAQEYEASIAAPTKPITQATVEELVSQIEALGYTVLLEKNTVDSDGAVESPEVHNQDVIDAIAKVIEMDDGDLLTATGAPKTEVLANVLQREVTANERDEAFASVKR